MKRSSLAVVAMAALTSAAAAAGTAEASTFTGACQGLAGPTFNGPVQTTCQGQLDASDPAARWEGVMRFPASVVLPTNPLNTPGAAPGLELARSGSGTLTIRPFRQPTAPATTLQLTVTQLLGTWSFLGAGGGTGTGTSYCVQRGPLTDCTLDMQLSGVVG